MKSIIQHERECLICGSWNVEEHLIYFEENHEKISEKYGLKVWLCPSHCYGTNGVYGKNGYKLDLELRQLGQKAFEWEHSRNEFIKLIGKNYLD